MGKDVTQTLSNRRKGAKERRRRTKHHHYCHDRVPVLLHTRCNRMIHSRVKVFSGNTFEYIYIYISSSSSSSPSSFLNCTISRETIFSTRLRDQNRLNEKICLHGRCCTFVRPLTSIILRGGGFHLSLRN